MDSHQCDHGGGRDDHPPLLPMEMMGTLQYTGPNMANIQPEISGIIRQGPLRSQDGEWTCYRRNYLACICSFSLSSIHPDAMIQFTPTPMSGTSNTPTLTVCGFAMSISAVVADNEQQAIELVQYTPKRDKGPISKPSKIPIAPRTSATPHNPSLGINGSSLSSSQSLCTDKFIGQANIGQEVSIEHIFERIQFKQATQNNGKRRSGQQYYHLVFELWADIGTQAADQFVKVAFRKSAKMMVRGRSPGHYQNKRRNSQGNGTGSAAGSRGFRCIGPMGDLINRSRLTRASLGSYNSGYDSRNTNYNDVGQQEISPESIFSSGDDKSSNKPYQHFTGGGGSSSSPESHGERADLFDYGNGTDTLHLGVHNNATNERKVKPRFDFSMLPSPFSSGGTDGR